MLLTRERNHVLYAAGWRWVVCTRMPNGRAAILARHRTYETAAEQVKGVRKVFVMGLTPGLRHSPRHLESEWR